MTQPAEMCLKRISRQKITRLRIADARHTLEKRRVCARVSFRVGLTVQR